MSLLYPSFVAGLHASARDRFAEPATTATLTAHWEAARAAWPDLALPVERFAADLARRMGQGATPATLEGTCAPDVYLAIACVDGNPVAIQRCDQLCEREVGIVASKLRATPDQLAEARSHLARVLLVDEPEHPAALRGFTGRGTLRAYARVIVTRDLIRTINRGRREATTANDEILERLATMNDPELSVLRARYHGAVTDAMRAAVANLDERTRALLRYQIVDGWNVDQVARVYGVHRATGARWLVAAREALGDAIQEELAARLDVDPDEVASIIRLVQSRVDVSLERLLG